MIRERKHDQETTPAQDPHVEELRREIDRLRSRVAELEAAASSQTDAALARQDALLQAMLRNLPFDFWARDLDENIIVQSDASVRLWGDLSTTRVVDADVSEQIRGTWRAVNERVYKGETLAGEKEYVLPSGEKRIFRDIVAPIRMGDEILGILGTNIDITEHVRSIRDLHESEAHLASLLNSIDESAALLEPDLQRKRIELDGKALEQAAAVQADRELLRQALFNLVQNAVQASPEGGTVELRMVP